MSSRADDSSHVRPQIDAYFARRGSAEGQRVIAAHLPECEHCRRYYERHQILARVDPAARSAQERIAAALGLSQERKATHAWPALSAVLVSAAAVAAGVFIARPTTHGEGEFIARGAPIADTPHLQVYRVDPGQPAEPLAAEGTGMRSGDDLAFAYDNPSGYERLLVFGVDEHRHVYWYYPAWTNPADAPRAVPVSRSTGPVELPEAIRQDIDGRALVLHAVFLHGDASVQDVEARVKRLASPEDPIDLPDAYEQRVRLAVGR